MPSTGRRPKIVVSGDGKGLVCQAGGLMLIETLRVSGMGKGLSEELKAWRLPRALHDPGKILTNLAVMLALGGDCLADVAVLRSSPEIFGPVASDPTISRLVSALAAAGPKAVRAIRAAWADLRRAGAGVPPAGPGPVRSRP
ncbi:transposase [Actinoallomurus spadix]|uniref:Transposase DDE domain-containing protein n=1 Tax=Actinoallomurus spadix TaxID=79912 RepID=A0ABN0X3A3_9ACTN|nr:transposase [Actinoallomurus spadix]